MNGIIFHVRDCLISSRWGVDKIVSFVYDVYVLDIQLWEATEYEHSRIQFIGRSAVYAD